jgi:hypothetical protein
MYNLINSNIHLVLEKIEKKWIDEYDWLISNLHDCFQPAYQSRYKFFWRLNAARLNEKFCSKYFSCLNVARLNLPDLATLVTTLHATPTHGDGRQSLQFSFASKLFHMVSPSMPIYDSLVAAFYFYGEPNRNLPIRQRVSSLVGFHSFLSFEYQRILKQKLIGSSISAFRNHFNPIHFTDEKIIDSLIGGFVSLAKQGAIADGKIQYK